MNRKTFVGLILIILIAIGVIIWAYYTKPEEEGLIVEEPFVEEPFIEIKPSCFDTGQDPVPICNCDDLQRMAENLSANYLLKNDTDCSETKNWNNGKGFKPIGPDSNNLFLGTFDGNNYVIVGLFINRPEENSVGLFSYSKGKIINVDLRKVNIKGYDTTGSLLANNYNGFVANSRAAGFVFGNDDTGGLVGSNQGTGKIVNSYTDVTVFDSNKDVGGIVGENDGPEAVIANCYALGPVSGKKGVGGVVGENEGIVINCYATGNITGDENVGGFVGDEEGIVLNSYALGTVSGNKDVGGFNGDNHGGIIKNSFSIGKVTGFDRAGGFNGVNHGGTITNCYWNKPAETLLLAVGVNKEGGKVSCVVIENNESYFYDPDNKPMNLWKFPPWTRMNEAKDFPVLELEKSIEEIDLKEMGLVEESSAKPEQPSAEPEQPSAKPEQPSAKPEQPSAKKVSCFDSSQDPIPICDCQDIQKIEEDLAANYVLKNDIDCSETKNWNNGKGFKPIGYDTNSSLSGFQGIKFTGTFDGRTYTISNLFISRRDEDYIGLFGYSGGETSNVRLIDVNITGNKSTGGLAGKNAGTITAGSTTGTVFSTDQNVGGLVGKNEKEGTIINSYSIATLSGGSKDVGGLIGENEGTVTNSYASGKVTGSENVGGLVGDNEGTITDSNAKGTVSGIKDVGGLVGDNEGAIKNCYWNKPAGSSLSCVGKNKGIGTVDCETR